MGRMGLLGGYTTIILMFLTLRPSRAFSTSYAGLVAREKTSYRYSSSLRHRLRHLNMSSSSSSLGASLAQCPTVPLRDGTPHPVIGFGTYKIGFIPASASAAASAPPPRSAEDCITDALDVGYRFLECAQFYNNERHIGQALAKSNIPRDQLFLCSKVWTTTIEEGPEAVRRQLQQTLDDLGTDYLDLYLIHWPVPGHHVTAYKMLIELKRQGKIRNIGVSNYAWEDYLELKRDPEIAPEDLPAVNQIEINPFLYRSKTIRRFADDGVVLQSYRSLRDGKAFDHPVVQAVAARHGKTPAQVMGRWCIQKGFIYVPKSEKRERMIENAHVFDFELSSEDMQRLDELTTSDAKQAFFELYQKCVNRDTSKAGTMEGVKTEITVD